MTITQLEDFICSLVNDITGKNAIWEKQNAPKPKPPYPVLRLFAYRPVGMPEYLPSDTALPDFKVYAHWEVTLEVQWLGPGSEEGLLTLQQSMERETIADRCAAAGVCVDAMGNITDIAELLDSADWEERQMAEFTVRFTRSVLDSPGVIETVNIGMDDDRTITVEKE